jgi:hypothetical protein
MKITTSPNFRFFEISKIFVLALLFGSMLVVFSTKQAEAKNVSYAVIDCFCDKDHAFSSVGEKYKERNGLNKADDIHWLLLGPTGTEITITFSAGNGCLGSVPFTDTTNPIKATITGRVDQKFDYISRTAAEVEGCFNYEITCSNWPAAQSQSATSDPIIDIPPKP